MESCDTDIYLESSFQVSGQFNSVTIIWPVWIAVNPNMQLLMLDGLLYGFIQ